jgi:hypothetical protein
MQRACISENSLFEQEALLGLLRYTQMSWPVRDFPPPDDPSWSDFVRNITADSELRNLFRKPFAAASVLRGAVEVDPDTHRIRIDLENARGRMLGERYPNLAHSLRKVGYETRGLITFG